MKSIKKLASPPAAMKSMEKLVRSNVRNWFCGLTENECYEALAKGLRPFPWDSKPSPERSRPYFKLKAMIEWCCEGDFWESNNQLEERTKK